MTMTGKESKISISTQAGVFIARYSDKGLSGLEFPQAGSRPSPVRSAQNVSAQVQRWRRLTVAALDTILAGQQPKSFPPFDWSGKTDFQQSVWAELLKIKAGQTRSYGEIAERIGRPKAVRAVGGACGANPIPVLVPCHRVLAANQKLGGFSGGLGWKKRLLAAENPQGKAPGWRDQ